MIDHPKAIDVERFKRLPKWAQHYITDLAMHAESVSEELKRTQNAQAITSGKRSWFVINGPKFEAPDKESRGLWVIDRDSPRMICTLGREDVLLVGKGIER